jgi:hypothetical protein
LRGREAAAAIQNRATNDNHAAKPGTLQPRPGLTGPQPNPLRGRASRGLDRNGEYFETNSLISQHRF